ncbi:MAG: pseudouridine synthase [Cytophagales bacterium]
MLEIVYKDENLIAINKPHGLLVHRSSIAADVSEFAVQLLRDQLGQRVYTIHRLDRKTSGVLLFALNPEAEVVFKNMMMDRAFTKNYLSIVRGYTDEHGTIDYALKNERGNIKDAVTHYKTLQQTEIDLPLGKHLTSRYSLVEATPVTGRMHQIRRHFSHIFHPIIGDRTHGCNKQNKLFTEKFSLDTMLLHARSVKFYHPILKQEILIEAKISSEFERMLAELNFKQPIY